MEKEQGCLRATYGKSQPITQTEVSELSNLCQKLSKSEAQYILHSIKKLINKRSTQSTH